MKKNKMLFKLFACCIPVKGATRSMICDIQRGGFDFIPNELYTILTENKDLLFDLLLKQYGTENRDVIQEYFDFLIEKEYGFWCSKKEATAFIDLQLDWRSPLKITNSIIDVSYLLEINLYSKFIKEIDSLGCEGVQLRYFNTKTVQAIDPVEILSLFENTRIKNIELILPFASDIISTCKQIKKQSLRVDNIYIHGVPESLVDDNSNKLPKEIYFVKDPITDETHCGIISPAYFFINMKNFTESLQFNSCLNRKISLDKEGNIKNCPSLVESYGNIKVTSLKEVMLNKAFQKKWTIKKDDIQVCKDCEFRYVCTDCRAFVEHEFDKPKKCNYDPYTGVWQN